MSGEGQSHKMFWWHDLKVLIVILRGLVSWIDSVHSVESIRMHFALGEESIRLEIVIVSNYFRALNDIVGVKWFYDDQVWSCDWKIKNKSLHYRPWLTFVEFDFFPAIFQFSVYLMPCGPESTPVLRPGPRAASILCVFCDTLLVTRLRVARGASLVFSDGKIVRIRVETTHGDTDGVLTIEQD